MVRAEGLNPDFRHWYLKPARLLIPPRPQVIHRGLRNISALTDAAQVPTSFRFEKTKDGASDQFRTGDLQCHKLAL